VREVAYLVLVLALGAFKAEADLLRGLSLLVEHWLSLTTETRLLTVVPSLACNRSGASQWGKVAIVNQVTDSPCAKREALPALYCDTLWGTCFLHFLLAQNVFIFFGICTCDRNLDWQPRGRRQRNEEESSLWDHVTQTQGHLCLSRLHRRPKRVSIPHCSIGQVKRARPA
jgi:hypothetical protein